MKALTVILTTIAVAFVSVSIVHTVETLATCDGQVVRGLISYTCIEAQP